MLRSSKNQTTFNMRNNITPYVRSKILRAIDVLFWQLHHFINVVNIYRPHPKDGEGVVFTRVCLSTGRREVPWITGPWSLVLYWGTGFPWSLVPGPFWGNPDHRSLVSGSRSFSRRGGTLALVLAVERVNPVLRPNWGTYLPFPSSQCQDQDWDTPPPP